MSIQDYAGISYATEHRCVSMDATVQFLFGIETGHFHKNFPSLPQKSNEEAKKMKPEENDTQKHTLNNHKKCKYI